MAQMPDSFKPIDMPDSFQPIVLSDQANQLEPSSGGLLDTARNLWDTVNRPLIDIRSGGLKTASDAFAAEHPYIGKPMNFLTDTLSSLTSPASLGLGALTAGGSIAEKAGLEGLAKTLEIPGKVASGGMVAHGGYNLVRPSATPEERVGGALEAGLGGLGLKPTVQQLLERGPKYLDTNTELLHGTQPENAARIRELQRFDPFAGTRQYDYSVGGPESIYFTTNPKSGWLSAEGAGRGIPYAEQVKATLTPDAKVAIINNYSDIDKLARKAGFTDGHDFIKKIQSDDLLNPEYDVKTDPAISAIKQFQDRTGVHGLDIRTEKNLPEKPADLESTNQTRFSKAYDQYYNNDNVKVDQEFGGDQIIVFDKSKVKPISNVDVPKVTPEELAPKVEPQLDLPLQATKRQLETSIPVEQVKTAPQKLIDALKESKPLNKEQRELYRVERAEKFGKASQVNVQGESDVPKFFGALKGEHTKVDIAPLRESLNQDEINDLFKQIGESKISTTEQANAFKGLSKLLGGGVPTDYDISQLGKVFGEDFANTLQKKMPWTVRRVLLEAGSIPKALKSAGDFGWPLRQGRNYAYRESWFKSIIPMARAYGSQAVYDARISMLKERPLFEKAKDAGIAFTDLASKTNREESAVASLVGNAPLVKQSNRAATIFANELRMNEFESQYSRYKTAYDSAMRIAKTPEEINAAKVLNPDSPYVASKLADRINTASGRGKLPGNLEKIAPELNSFMFSPRLMSARIRSISRILNAANPLSSQTTLERTDALKQLLSIAAAGATEASIVYGIAKTAGYEPRIETDPRSSDFMKVQIGNARFDPYGGFQQYIVPVFKIGTNSAKALKSREVYRLGSGYGKQTGFDVGVDALANKASPMGSLAIAQLKGSEVGGQKLDYTNPNPFENSITKALTNPFILQDAYEIIKEDPYLLPLLGPDMMGQSVQVYGNQKK